MVTEADMQDLMTTGLKTYFHDPLLVQDQFDTAVTQTATVTGSNCRVLMQTDVQQDSEARVNYNRSFFNPRYSVLRMKLRFNSASDVFAFWGFKSTLSAPTWHMDESHAGFMIYNGTLYAVTGGSLKGNPPDIVDYQTTPITDIDLTRWLIYEIEFNKFRWYSLPYTVPYFDKNVIPKLEEGLIRKWSQVYENGNVLPQDEMHYLVFYLTNSVGANKTMELQHVTYSEVYAD
jgi:hypothetical protein